MSFFRIMRIKKEFKGKLIKDGDDPYCFGVHQGFKDDNSPPNEDAPVIIFLDEIAERFKGKKATIKVIVEIED